MRIRRCASDERDDARRKPPHDWVRLCSLWERADPAVAEPGRDGAEPGRRVHHHHVAPFSRRLQHARQVRRRGLLLLGDVRRGGRGGGAGCRLGEAHAPILIQVAHGQPDGCTDPRHRVHRRISSGGRVDVAIGAREDDRTMLGGPIAVEVIGRKHGHAELVHRRRERLPT